MSTHILDHQKSSIFEKLTPHLRRELDCAIANRKPATYRALYDHFNLAAHGVSFASLCRYAKRLRDAATLGNLSELVLPDSEQHAKHLPKFLCQHLMTQMIIDEPNDLIVHRLTDAYRMAARVHLDDQRLDFNRERAEFLDQRAALAAKPRPAPQNQSHASHQSRARQEAPRNADFPEALSNRADPHDYEQIPHSARSETAQTRTPAPEPALQE